jgi:hypothetical protein
MMMFQFPRFCMTTTVIQEAWLCGDIQCHKLQTNAHKSSFFDSDTNKETDINSKYILMIFIMIFHLFCLHK